MAKLTKAQQVEKEEAIQRLKELCPAGTRVYCVLRHVSRSGMRRVIQLVVIDEEGDRSEEHTSELQSPI